MAETNTERSCPRCQATLQAEARQGDEGLVHLWRCECGWAGVRTVNTSQVAQGRRSGLLHRVFGDGRVAGEGSSESVNPGSRHRAGESPSESESRARDEAAEKSLEDLGFSRR